jgi:hypothetical protein
MRRRDLFVVGKITINLGSSPKSTYYKAKKLGNWGWLVWDAQAWVNIPKGHHVSPAEIGSNIVWFANHGWTSNTCVGSKQRSRNVVDPLSRSVFGSWLPGHRHEKDRQHGLLLDLRPMLSQQVKLLIA